MSLGAGGGWASAEYIQHFGKPFSIRNLLPSAGRARSHNDPASSYAAVAPRSVSCRAGQRKIKNGVSKSWMRVATRALHHHSLCCRSLKLTGGFYTSTTM
jgi:hypothetical protein